MKRFVIIEDKVYECPEALVGFDFIKCNSSKIAYVGYERETMILFVQFHWDSPFVKGKMFFGVYETVWGSFTKRINSPGYILHEDVEPFYKSNDSELLIKETSVRELLICYNNLTTKYITK